MNPLAGVQGATRPPRGLNILAHSTAPGLERRNTAALDGRTSVRPQRQPTNSVAGVSPAFSGAPAARILFILFASTFWTGFGEAGQREMHLAGELQTHRELAVFSGDSVELVFQFIDADPAAHIFSADLYQESSALAVPVFRDQPPATAGATVGAVVGEVAFLVNLPAVERKTAFLLRMKTRSMDEDNWRVAGKITLVAHPPLDWGALRQRYTGTLILSKGDGCVGDFLTSVGFAMGPDTTDEGPVPRGIVLWESGAAADEVARIEPRGAGTETVQHAFLPPLEDLAIEAHSQITLYRMMEAAIAQHNRCSLLNE